VQSYLSLSPQSGTKTTVNFRPVVSEFGQLRSFEQTDKRSECASLVKIIASIEDPAVIKQILAHLEKKRNQKNSTYCREQSVRFVPKVANNCSTKNDCYGAKAALCFQTSNYWFVPKAVIYHQRCGLGRVRLHLFVRRPISLE
jgi:hypothetical protein